MNVINFDNRNCKKIRAYLDSYVNNELSVDTCHEVLKHLEACADCSGEMDSRLRVKGLLRNAVRRDCIPAELKGRIQKELRTETSPSWRYRVAAAAVIAMLVGGWGVVRFLRPPAASDPRYPGAQVLKVGLDNHVHCSIERRFAGRRFSSEEMSSKLGPEYFGLVSLVEREAPGKYDIVVGHRCHANNREYVHLILKSERDTLSLVITRKSGESFKQSDLAAVLSASGVPLYQSRLEEYEVAGFETRDHLAFVVSDLPAGDNLQIASTLAAGVLDYLSRLEV
jgi:anti-sigma factor (TIGR02949 family)